MLPLLLYFQSFISLMLLHLHFSLLASPSAAAAASSCSRVLYIAAPWPEKRLFKRAKHGTGTGVAADPVTMRSESSAAASSNDDSEAATSASSSDF
jgi:hypothetical protein